MNEAGTAWLAADSDAVLHVEGQQITDLKRINQMANFALLEWPDNIDVSDEPPSVYVPKLKARFAPEGWARMYELHALPADWEQMSYDDFLVERRKLMAGVVREGFAKLGTSSRTEL